MKKPVPPRRLLSRHASVFSILIFLLGGMCLTAAQKSPGAKNQIFGWVKSGDVPLPGVSISAFNAATGQQVITSTGVDGSYVLVVPGAGRYRVSARFAAFAPAAREVSLNNSHSQVRADFQLTLQSRVRTPAQGRPNFAQARQPATDLGNEPVFLSLPVQQGDNPAEASQADTNSWENTGETPPSGVSPESVAISGAAPQMSQTLRMPQLGGRMRGPGSERGPGGGPPGGGPGMRRGFGGGRRVMIMRRGRFGRGRGRFNVNRVHGMLAYTLGDSAFDAKPYSLTGQSLPKPAYVQNHFSVALGGPLDIPKIYKGGRSSFFFLSYNGSRSTTPYDSFSTVPTLAERLGNFSATSLQNGSNAGLPVQIFDPKTHLPFTGNIIPASRIDPVAAGLLNFIPLPNLPGDVQNFHLVTSVDANAENLNFRLIHNFGGRGGFFGRRFRRRAGSNINVGFRYHTAGNGITNPNPFVGGNTSVQALDIPVGYVVSRGRVTNIFRFDFNRNRTSTQNLYAFSQNLTSQFGINGVSQNPFDWGLPNLSFTDFSGIRDITPALRRDQTLRFSDFMIWSRGRHTWRWGGDFRRIQHNIETDANARGTFTFTGFNTAAVAGGTAVPGTGFDFADFLLGLPQQTSAQFGTDAYYFRGNSWDLFAQDVWRVRSNVTLNLGVRYEYVSPFTEKYNRIVNLDPASGFAAVAPVQPGRSGFPATLMNPDRNNFAPRLGLAWRALRNTVVRTGYGINYNTTAYSSIIQNLAFQPPFAFTQTNIQSPALPLSLANGFPSSPAAITNNFGVDRNYRLGYVQIWNVDIQQQMPWGVLLNLDYTGTKGTHLDMLRAPNRRPSGLLISGVQPFLWESSEGNSIMHAATIRVRRRFEHGFAIGGSYVYSKSIDNASSIGGGATVVAQNDLNLAAERGLSSFDQRHLFSADYLYELPFGADKRWLFNKGPLTGLLGNWQLNGTLTIASGTPFTARVLGNFAEVGRGTNGTLRADATGLPVSLDNPTAALFFNTAAFAVPPPGQFGNAQRNTIPGPRTLTLNMSMTKLIPLGDVRSLELRAVATNLFNTPQFTTIDTTVNSPSYGRVLTVGAMRTIQFAARFRF